MDGGESSTPETMKALKVHDDGDEHLACYAVVYMLGEKTRHQAVKDVAYEKYWNGTRPW